MMESGKSKLSCCLSCWREENKSPLLKHNLQIHCLDLGKCA
jgi:hypothetical protein